MNNKYIDITIEIDEVLSPLGHPEPEDADHVFFRPIEAKKAMVDAINRSAPSRVLNFLVECFSASSILRTQPSSASDPLESLHVWPDHNLMCMRGEKESNYWMFLGPGTRKWITIGYDRASKPSELPKFRPMAAQEYD